MKYIRLRAASMALALALLLGLLPATAAGGFSDVGDPATAQNLEVLQLMGVVEGNPGSVFNPGGELTRAQFCKMAVEAMGQGDRAAIYQNYTIFPDVRPGYWAAGYINLASRTDVGSAAEGTRTTRLIGGLPDGSFGPERTITYGQAITLLMRMLGYGDSDVSAVWPDGYIDLALTMGLSEGVSLPAASPVTRAQAAQLFVNLLSCETRGGGKFYSTLGSAVEAVLLNANAKDEDGNPVMITSADTYDLAGSPGAGVLAGRKGVVILNEAGEAVTFIPAKEGSSRSVTIAKAEAQSLTDSSGAKYSVAANATIYRNNEPEAYGSSFSFLRSGTLATLYINSRGRVETVYVGATTSDDAVVVARDGSTEGFFLLTDRTDYKIYKHGEEIEAADLKQYDVATYSSSNNTVYISDNRVTVYYLNAYPNASAPTRVKGVGIVGDGEDGYLDVLPCAMETVANVKLGQTVTLLLTEHNKVAGMAAGGSVRGNALGYVGDSGITLFNGLEVDAAAVPGNLDSLRGQLVTVASSNRRSLTVSRFTTSAVSGDLYVSEGRVGSTGLAVDVRIYEKAGASALTEVSLSDLSGVIASEDIAYAYKNPMGKVSILVLENASGAGYIYGRVSARSEATDSIAGVTIYNTFVTVDSATGRHGPYMSPAFPVGAIVWGGVIPDADGQRLTAYVVLDEVKDVPTSAFRDSETVYHNGVTYAVSKGVVCYNAASGIWLPLGEALAFSDRCKLYIDDGGVVRGVEVE